MGNITFVAYKNKEGVFNLDLFNLDLFVFGDSFGQPQDFQHVVVCDLVNQTVLIAMDNTTFVAYKSKEGVFNLDLFNLDLFNLDLFVFGDSFWRATGFPTCRGL